MKFHYLNKQSLQCRTASKETLLYVPKEREGLVSHKRSSVATWVSGCKESSKQATQLTRWFDAHLQYCVLSHNCLWSNWMKEKLDSRERRESHSTSILSPYVKGQCKMKPPWKEETIRLIAPESPVLRLLLFYWGV